VRTLAVLEPRSTRLLLKDGKWNRQTNMERNFDKIKHDQEKQKVKIFRNQRDLQGKNQKHSDTIQGI